MELKLGKMTYRELSAWFGYKDKDGFAKAPMQTKIKKLTLLQAYADFHFEGKQIYIDKIHNPVYEKAYQILEREFENEWGNYNYGELQELRIDTCRNLGRRLWNKYPEIQASFTLETTCHYLNRIKVERYGRNYLPDDQGTRGCSEYVLMNRTKTGPLEPEKQKIVQECKETAYEQISDIAFNIDEDYRKGILTKTERDNLLQNIDIPEDSYDRYAELVRLRLGFMPIKRTKLIQNT